MDAPAHTGPNSDKFVSVNSRVILLLISYKWYPPVGGRPLSTSGNIIILRTGRGLWAPPGPTRVIFDEGTVQQYTGFTPAIIIIGVLIIGVQE